jgi:hypothetical protein
MSANGMNDSASEDAGVGAGIRATSTARRNLNGTRVVARARSAAALHAAGGSVHGGLAPVEVTAEMVQAARVALLVEKQRSLEDTVDRHDDKVRRRLGVFLSRSDLMI